mmetsp:Transcript_16589/g.35033  ORF Transcript_16589/g.35033 Transcript_16589/m.35033 type:complete len:103 (-) Transcript_16589:52-360(-)
MLALPGRSQAVSAEVLVGAWSPLAVVMAGPSTIPRLAASGSAHRRISLLAPSAGKIDSALILRSSQSHPAILIMGRWAGQWVLVCHPDPGWSIRDPWAIKLR